MANGRTSGNRSRGQLLFAPLARWSPGRNFCNPVVRKMATDWTSSRVAAISISAIKEMAIRAAAVPGAASLAWGLPSFPTPEHIREAVANRLTWDPDIGKYSLPDGLPEFREIIAKNHFGETGVQPDPAENILVTAGNMQGLNAVFNTIINPGDEIIVTDPGFASHFQQIKLFDGKPVYWRLNEADGWSLDPEALQALITSKTKAIVLVSPSNPTGRIFSEADLRRVGEIALQNGLLILIDDPYSHFTYENRDSYFNLASVPELRETIVYLFTFSKAYAMSGWRIGYMILPACLKRQVIKVHDATLICPPRISQVAGIAALTHERVHLQDFEATLNRRRSLICNRLDRVGHVFTYVRPQGAYYVFPRIVADHKDSTTFAGDLLNTARVTVTPGSAFGPAGESHIRMAFCVDDNTINLAFDRIEAAFTP